MPLLQIQDSININPHDSDSMPCLRCYFTGSIGNKESFGSIDDTGYRCSDRLDKSELRSIGNDMFWPKAKLLEQRHSMLSSLVPWLGITLG